MDSDSADDGFTSSSTTENPESASYGGTIFSGSQHFTVAGGTFTSITKNYIAAPPVPSDVRRIPLGDIDLQREIILDNESSVVNCRLERRRLRRIHSAKIEGRKSRVTVAMYQGNGAEEEWRRDIAKYASVRHPNIIQIYGVASLGNIHATIFHDDLIPFQQFLDRYRHSPILTVYIYGYCTTEFQAADNYLYSAFQRSLLRTGYTIWIRHSTGRLCAELESTEASDWHPWGTSPKISHPPEIKSLDVPNNEATVVDSLTLHQYHATCYCELRQTRFISISALATVNLGAVISSLGNQPEDSHLIEIASLLNVDLRVGAGGWEIAGHGVGEVMEDGWTCFASGDVSDTMIQLWLLVLDPLSWLSQANYIFSRLGITSNFEDYAVMEDIGFTLEISATTADPPTGFLFLCPLKDLQTGPSSFKWPDCPAYWSLDPSGVEPLSMEDATELGFPSIEFWISIVGYYWDASVYAGIRQFHKAKGFNRDSQDIARHLGHELYQLSNTINIPFAHIDGEHSFDGDDPGVTTDGESKDTRKTSDEHPDVEPDLEHSCLEQEKEVSRTFKIVMNVQLTLILFLALSWLYDQV